jgi:hypothetical protein
MGAHDLVTIQRTFEQCFKDIAVFERYDMDGQFFEVNDVQKDNGRWLVIAAGLSEAEAKDFFAGNPARAQKSLVPLRYRSRCKISLLFVLRPFEENPKYPNQTILVSPFAPTKRIPWIEIRQAYMRILDIPDNDIQLSSVRWEWDAVPAVRDPDEKWLRSWKYDCGFNPAHPPSHLHLNSRALVPGSITRPGDLKNELRIAIGRPNPLAFILSIAAWFRGV